MKSPEILVVVHLSNNAINTVIGQIISPQDVRILGLSSVKNHDFSQGVIRHRERLKAAIKQSIQQAEDIANCRVRSVWLSFSTPDLISQNSIGSVTVDGGTVEAKDIVAALTDAKDKHISDNLYLMHYSQQGIILDDSPNMIDDAIGMTADNVAVLYHLMMMPVQGRQNLQQLLQECDVSIDHMIFDAVSTAEYGLLEEEKHHGICFIDIGAGTTSVCVYSEDKLISTHCFAEGGYDVTLDISHEMGIAIADAENVKKLYASVDRNGIDPALFTPAVRLVNQEERRFLMGRLMEVSEARYLRIFNQIKAKLIEEQLDGFLHNGFVIAGGGAEMRGILPLAKRVFNQKVNKVTLNRAISPHIPYEENEEKLKFLSDSIKLRQYQTAFGALLYSQSEAFLHSEKSSPDSLQHSSFKMRLKKMSELLKKVF